MLTNSLKKSQNTFYCENCDYNTCIKNNYNKHILTRKHEMLTGCLQKNLCKNGKKYTCECCNFITSDKYDYNKHLMTRKHFINNSNTKKSEHEYICDKCDYKTTNKSDYNKHLRTRKHKLTLNEISNIPSYICNVCNSSYTTRQSLWRHKKKCNLNNNNDYIHNENNSNDNVNNKYSNNISNILNEATIDNDNITLNKTFLMEILKQNQDFKEMMIEQTHEFKNQFINYNNIILELSQKENTTITNNHTTNNSFNLNIFLNEKCKDALNLKDFINSIVISNEDLEFVGEHGYTIGFTQKLLHELKQLDIYKRPIHCTDIKREVIHVKEDDKWDKDINDNEKIKQMINTIAYKSFKMIAKWQQEHPECEILDSHEYKIWMDITRNTLNSGDKNNKKLDEILKNIARCVYIDKYNEAIK